MLTNLSHVIYVTLAPILSTVFVALNVVTIYIFRKKFKIVTISTILIINICVCDIFVCLVSNTFYMYNLMHPVFAWRSGSLCCKLFKFLTMLNNVAQIYFLCFLTADRLRRLLNSTGRQWRKKHGLVFTAVGWIAACILTTPRVFLFEEKLIRKVSSETNQSIVVNVNCKPVGLDDTGYITSTILLFTFGYLIPACYIVYSAVRTHLFMRKRRNTIHISSTRNFVTRMKSQLSLSFNLTATFFIVIWTPFFLLSVMDLTLNLLQRKDLVHVNVTLRCTILILGSAKPFIYIASLEKFRACFSLEGGADAPKTTSSIQDVSAHNSSTATNTDKNTTKNKTGQTLLERQNVCEIEDIETNTYI